MVFLSMLQNWFYKLFYRAFLCILAHFDSWTSRIVTFFTAIYFYQIDNSGSLISHFFKITNHGSIIFLKLSIYIQIVIRLASIHRLSICIIDLPTTCIWVLCGTVILVSYWFKKEEVVES
jgi:hypothetical protein